jgi:hypothetical protein
MSGGTQKRITVEFRWRETATRKIMENKKDDKEIAVSRSPAMIGSASATITEPNGTKREIYFECAGCGRNAIWTLTDNGRCEKCYHDKFKIHCWSNTK